MKKTLVLTISIFLTFFLLSPVFAQENDNVFPDNGNVGIGVTEPEDKLSIAKKEGSCFLRIRKLPSSQSPYGSSGIYIGSNTQITEPYFPGYGTGHLHLFNTFRIWLNAPTVDLGVRPEMDENGGEVNLGGTSWANRLVVSQYINTRTPKPGDDFIITDNHHFSVNGRSYFRNFVGIGTTCIPEDTTYLLGVKGKILCEGLKVKIADGNCWADHVFDQNYALKTLEEVEQFINAHKHLPDIPSEQKLVSEGIEMADMMKLQMLKIEELTLYLIEQKKEIQELKQELKRSNEIINELISQ